jgi:F5/8 type C domain
MTSEKTGLLAFADRTRDWMGEFFLLREAERTARAYTPAQRDRIDVHHVAAEERFRAARRLIDPVCSAVLVREALLGYLRAAAIARAHALDVARADVPAGCEAWDAQGARIPPDPLEPDAAGDVERVRAALAASAPLFFDQMSGRELARTRGALDRAAFAIRGAGRVRSLAYVRGARFGRIAAVIVTLAFVVYRVLEATFWPDLAHGKPVTSSSVMPGSPDGHDLVDGTIGTSFALATNNEESPWIQVDLLRVYRLTAVDVYNRVDGWFDDCLPLVLQTSVDGVTWDDVGRRDTTFIYDPPWIVHVDHKPARFVRVHALRRTYLALSRIAVFGSK